MSIIPKIKKPTELRNSIFETLDKNVNGQVFLIPHKTGNSVLISEENHEALLEKIESLSAINQGLQDYVDGKVFSHTEIKHFLSEKKKKWTKKK